MDERELLLASLHKQFLLSKGKKQDIVASLCGLQAQFANNPGHALRIRADDYQPLNWNSGMVKTWTFRHTLHLVPKGELDLFLSAAGIPKRWQENSLLKQRRKTLWASRLRSWIQEGITGREELKKKCREKGMTSEEMGIVFHGWGGLIREMCRRGMIAYDSGTAKRFVLCENFKPIDCDYARAEILKRYFQYLGPATFSDCAAFTGLKRKTVQDVLAKHPLPLKSTHCKGEEYCYLGEWNVKDNIPSCIFLAGFDQLLLAYRNRNRLLDDKNKPDVVTNTGIIHPTVLVDGRLKAKWKKNGKSVLITPFAALTKRNRNRIVEYAEKLFGDDITEVKFAE